MWVWLYSYDIEVASSFDEHESPIHACDHWASFFLAHLTLGCLLSVHSHYLLRYKKWHYTMPYIFVRCDVSHLDDCNAFDATRWGHDKTTYIDFQLVKDGNGRTLSELIGSNLSGSRLDRNEREYDHKKPYYQTYWCQYPLHVVFNELEILAGYKVIAANTTKEIFVWTLHKP